MVSALTPPYYPNNSVEGHYFNEDDSMLKESMMDRSLELSSPMMGRRESAAAGALYSPKQEDAWGTDMQSLPSSNGSVMASSQQTAFFGADVTTPPMMGTTAAASWATLTPGAGMGIGMGVGMGVGVDGMPMAQQFESIDGFDPVFASQQQMLHANSAFSGMNAGLFSGMMPSGAVTGSPTNMNMTVTAMDGIAAIANGSKRSPVAQAVLHELRRGDGIRKKNARFDIPVERNLTNIDQLIAQSTDEQEIKELKQQKRLLRNRQAALDSRQRKKMHTERLEDEKKQFTVVISDMEEELAMLRKEIECLSIEKRRFQEYIQGQTMDKENMIRDHTLETGELRKKVSLLTSHVHRLETDNANLRGGRGGAAFTNGLDGCYSPDTTPQHTPSPTSTGWDAPAGAGGFLDAGFGGNAKQVKTEPTSPHMVQAQQFVSMNKTELSEETSVERSAASGNGQNSLLFMLFLVGAYVISAGSPSAAAPVLTAISADMRTTTVGLLRSLFKNAGVDMAASSPNAASASWAMPVSSEMSMIGTLGDMLTLPSHEQTNEHIFALSAAQYGNADMLAALDGAQPKAPTDQRNLAGALNVLRGSGNAAEVCSRSLLREQIPLDVVRSFARMVGHGASGCSSAGPSMASAKA